MATFHFEQKTGKRGNAAQHSRYIQRASGFFSDRSTSDLVAYGYGNMPGWAHDSPDLFWKASDKHERKNGTTYREAVFALPRELTLTQQVKLVTTYIAERLGDKPYEYAIHCPNAAINGGLQPHAHIMYSDRIPDDIERPPEQLFRRYNSNFPELGGCRKDSGAASRSALRDKLVAERSYFADLQNSFLADYGHTSRVDHRSFAARGLALTPEKHLGQAGVRGLNQDDMDRFKAQRAQTISSKNN